MYESVQCSCGATVSFGATDSCSVGLALILFDKGCPEWHFHINSEDAVYEGEWEIQVNNFRQC